MHVKRVQCNYGTQKKSIGRLYSIKSHLSSFCFVTCNNVTGEEEELEEREKEKKKGKGNKE